MPDAKPLSADEIEVLDYQLGVHDLDRAIQWSRVRSTLAARDKALAEARVALQAAIKIAESWAHDQLDGTADLAGALEELDFARAALQPREAPLLVPDKSKIPGT